MHADKTGTPKFRGSGCQFPQSQCHPSPRTGIALGTRLTGSGNEIGLNFKLTNSFGFCFPARLSSSRTSEKKTCTDADKISGIKNICTAPAANFLLFSSFIYMKF